MTKLKNSAENFQKFKELERYFNLGRKTQPGVGGNLKSPRRLPHSQSQPNN